MSYYLRVTKQNPEKLANKKLKEDFWRQRNQESFNKRSRERTRQNKLKAIEYLGGRCFKCEGVFHPSVYDFHHRNPEEKDIGVSVIKGRSWERLKEELDKCDLLCANCHREIHYVES